MVNLDFWNVSFLSIKYNTVHLINTNTHSLFDCCLTMENLSIEPNSIDPPGTHAAVDDQGLTNECTSHIFG